MKKDIELLQTACRTWMTGAEFRKRRRRYKRYTYGDQWSDIVYDRNNRAVREEYMVSKDGRPPFTNNLIRRMVKTVVGRYRADNEDKKYYSNSAADEALFELDCRMLEEFLISGGAVQYLRALPGQDENGATAVSNVNIPMFFVNPYRDPLGRDIELLGQCHDLTMAQLLKSMGKRDIRRMEWLRNFYKSLSNSEEGSTLLGGSREENFYRGAPGRYRVVEVWKHEATIKRDSGEVITQWKCHWLAPDGTVLKEEPPCDEHPFTIKFYPLTDGEVHSFVEDVIDQQRYINRLIAVMDRIVSSAAKGVLLFPTDQLPKDYGWDRVCEAWAQTDGVIPITGRGQYLPQQVVTPAGADGAFRLLTLQMKMFDDISGVTEALTGKVSMNQGAAMYEQQTRNAAIALSDLLLTFRSFINERKRKMVKIK